VWGLGWFAISPGVGQQADGGDAEKGEGGGFRYCLGHWRSNIRQALGRGCVERRIEDQCPARTDGQATVVRQGMAVGHGQNAGKHVRAAGITVGAAEDQCPGTVLQQCARSDDIAGDYQPIQAIRHGHLGGTGQGQHAFNRLRAAADIHGGRAARHSQATPRERVA